MLIKTGYKVRVLEQSHVIENYEVSPAGRIGRVMAVEVDDLGDLDLVVVRLHRPLEGLEHWDNQLQYHKDDGYEHGLEHYLMHNLEFVQGPLNGH